MSESVKLYIPIILGTNRSGRQTEKVANFIMEEVRRRDDIESDLFDVRKFNFKQDDYGESEKDLNPEWRDAVARADGLIIISPEYNHGYPGVLKEALDLLFNEYNHRAVGVAGVSDGQWGGARMVENLIPVLYELGLVMVRPPLYFPNAPKLFDNDGVILDEGYKKRVAGFLASLCPVEEGACTIGLPYDKALIASRLGMKPESLSRSFARLRSIGVRVERGVAAISDVRRLKDYAEGARGSSRRSGP